jgi:hypothetical protein
MDQMRKKLKKIKEEIAKFQKNCKHEHQQIRFDERNEAKWYCTLCDMFIRRPSQKELDDWISR